jgi:predicted GTPase
MFGFEKSTLRIVVGLNQVDKIVPNGWDMRLNAPSKAAEKEIERRCIEPSQVEFYSALKRYRLIPLISTVTRYAFAGFKLDNVEPADPFELADKDVQEFVAQQLSKDGGKSLKSPTKDHLFEEMSKYLSRDELNLVRKKFAQEKQIPPKVAVFGKTGVGKTTTINSLFNANWKTSHTVVGTTDAQIKEFELQSGGTLEIIDLPGYGVSLSKDRGYEKLYQEHIPSCDLVLLIIQANSRDFSDDQEMLGKVVEWVKKAPTPVR